jgi:hypothetical protein
MKTSAQRLEILRAKFARLERSVKKPNWSFTGNSVIVHRNSGDIELFEDRLEFDNEVIPLSSVKKVIWMGRDRPSIQGTSDENARDHKKNNYDKIGFELENSAYFELDCLGDAYADFLKYIEWAKEHGSL